jgi:hypothetical protein
MAAYFVVDADTPGQRVALQDGLKRYYLATAPGAVPRPGTALHGPAMAQGISEMTDPAHGQVFRLNFSTVRCTEDDMLRWLGTKG